MKKEKLDYFDKLIEQSVQYKGNRCKRFPNHLYFKDEYADLIKDYFNSCDPQVVSYEVNVNEKYGNIPICAFASSGRLCYLDFINRLADKRINSLRFEMPLENDHTDSNADTKMDAVDLINNVYYECKCQEIRNKSKGGLKTSYKKCSKLFNEIGIEHFLNKESDEYLSFRMSELGVTLNKDPLYTNLHFDVKQLICHIIALANIKDDKEKTLQYVIYKPKQELIDRNGYARRLYKELDEEIAAIFADGTKIKAFCKKHNIVLKKPEYVFIETIDDFNYYETFIINNSRVDFGKEIGNKRELLDILTRHYEVDEKTARIIIDNLASRHRLSESEETLLLSHEIPQEFLDAIQQNKNLIY